MIRRVVFVLFSVVLVVPGVTASASGPPSFSLPEQASEVAPGVFFLGHAVQDGVVVEGYAYAWFAAAGERGRSAKAKPSGTPGGGPGNGGGGGGGEETSASCYSFIARGAHWNTIEGYLFNPANSNIGNVGLDGTDGAFGTWEAAAGSDIVGPGEEATGLVADTSGTDGDNEIYFASISDPGVLGYTIVWSTRSRGRNAGQVVETDMVVDDDDWNWYTGAAGGIGGGQIDFWSVFVHEAGHWVGMGHTETSDLCSEQAMYPYIGSGDSTKRELGDGDVTGVSTLYG